MSIIQIPIANSTIDMLFHIAIMEAGSIVVTNLALVRMTVHSYRKITISTSHVDAGSELHVKYGIAIERLKQGESINVQDLGTQSCIGRLENSHHRVEKSLDRITHRFYKMVNELVQINVCYIHQVNVQFLLQLQPEWQRFVTLVKQSQKLKTVSYHVTPPKTCRSGNVSGGVTS
ncbi:hypothetical protein Tco_0843179 [Tanacetum coccineum]|uniref:Uncharacterized protein n=1 Tax=Tanacetum coccineum TaxID=301880 RepID=A0ABQ5B3K5_9ASTR